MREVRDHAARDRFVSNVASHLYYGVTEEGLERAFDWWRNKPINRYSVLNLIVKKTSKHASARPKWLD